MELKQQAQRARGFQVCLLAATMISLVTAQIECPTLKCPEPGLPGGLEDGVCFEHDGESPTLNLKGGLCYDADNRNEKGIVSFCPFSYLEDEYQWIIEYLQEQRGNDLNMKNSEISQLKKRKKQALCKDARGFRQGLNPNRQCSSHNQCKSKLCKENSPTKTCFGSPVDTNCHSHADCEAQTYCKVLSYWPFQSKCTVYLKDGDPCEEDFECATTHFCWYKAPAAIENKQKSCMQAYSQNDGKTFGWFAENPTKPSLDDYQSNGKFCKSGLAYNSAENTAKCTSATEIQFDGKVTEQPYKCEPTDPSLKCHIMFDIDNADRSYVGDTELGYVQADCRCSMSEVAGGFCSSVIGTDDYKKAVAHKRLVYERSNCHTLDREDLRAQRDHCGIGFADEEWRFAVDQQFNVTHWPYIQADETYHCVQKFFADSYINLSLESAQTLQLVGSTLTAFILASLF